MDVGSAAGPLRPLIPMESRASHVSPKSGLALLTLGALGVVYGDIGTSPLYALRECFHGEYGIAPTHDNVVGVLSLIVWSLILVVSDQVHRLRPAGRQSRARAAFWR